MRIAFGLDSTLEDLYDQIYDDPNIEDTDPNDGIDDNDPNYHQILRVTKETGYDGTILLADIFDVSVTATPEVVLTTGDAPQPTQQAIYSQQHQKTPPHTNGKLLEHPRPPKTIS